MLGRKEKRASVVRLVLCVCILLVAGILRYSLGSEHGTVAVFAQVGRQVAGRTKTEELREVLSIAEIPQTTATVLADEDKIPTVTILYATP